LDTDQKWRLLKNDKNTCTDQSRPAGSRTRTEGGTLKIGRKVVGGAPGEKNLSEEAQRCSETLRRQGRGTRTSDCPGKMSGGKKNEMTGAQDLNFIPKFWRVMRRENSLLALQGGEGKPPQRGFRRWRQREHSLGRRLQEKMYLGEPQILLGLGEFSVGGFKDRKNWAAGSVARGFADTEYGGAGRKGKILPNLGRKRA